MVKMKKLEPILLTEIWNDLLGLTNKTSVSLQNNTVTSDVATKPFASLVDYISSAEIPPSTNLLPKKKIQMLMIKFILKEK